MDPNIPEEILKNEIESKSTSDTITTTTADNTHPNEQHHHNNADNNTIEPTKEGEHKHHHHHGDENNNSGTDGEHKHHHHHHEEGGEHKHHHHHDKEGDNHEHHHHHHDRNNGEHIHHHHKHSKAEEPQLQLSSIALEINDKNNDSVPSTSLLEPPSTIPTSAEPPITTVTTPAATITAVDNVPGVAIAVEPPTDPNVTTTIVVSTEAVPSVNPAEPPAIVTTINVTTTDPTHPAPTDPSASSSTPVINEPNTTTTTAPTIVQVTTPTVISSINIATSDTIPKPIVRTSSYEIQNEAGSSEKPESQRKALPPHLRSRKEWRASTFMEPPMPAEHKKDRLKHGPKLAHKKNTLGETIYKGHPSWLLMRDIQTGLYTNIRNMATGTVAYDLYATPPVTVLPKAPNSPETFKFKDYCPMAFFKLREHFGINHVDYITSLCQNWNEVGTPGKSGSLFFFSLDNQYVLKTIPKREAKLLRELLPDYYNFMTSHSDSLITRFMGLHRIKPHKGRQVRFLVMGNLFNSNLKVHQRFDLKGSTVGRELSPAERAKKSPTFKYPIVLYT